MSTGSGSGTIFRGASGDGDGAELLGVVLMRFLSKHDVLSLVSGPTVPRGRQHTRVSEFFFYLNMHFLSFIVRLPNM